MFLNSTRIKKPLISLVNKGNYLVTLKLDSRGVEDDIMVFIPPTTGRKQQKTKIPKHKKI